MFKNQNPVFDYHKEPSRDILCIDCKSFYASVECVSLGLDPLTTKLVVMSYPGNSWEERGSGLILASSPAAKKAYGITNISRARDLPFPYPSDLYIAPPRMAYYMEKNKEINAIYKTYADESNHHVYSVDESFLDITNSLNLFDAPDARALAKKIRQDVYDQTGIYTTIGIGDNPLLAKLALDNEAKDTRDMIAEWRYEDVPEKLWRIPQLTDFWGIGRKTAIRLNKMNIHSIYELAHADYYRLKSAMGVIGTQLYAHAWGIDRSFLGEVYTPKSKSIGNSQILNKDYTRREEIEIVIKEMADQVGTRLRREEAKAQVVSLWVGFSLGYTDVSGKTGFHQQMKIEPTNVSHVLAEALLMIFDRHYQRQDIRSIGVNCSRLVYATGLQLNLFDDPKEQVNAAKIDFVVDKIRQKYGFKAIVHAHSLLEGGRAIARSSLVGGHAGGMAGIEGEGHATHEKEFLDYNEYRDRPFGLKWGTAFAMDELVKGIEENAAVALKDLPPQLQMTREEIDQVLLQSFLYRQKVTIQLNTKDEFGRYRENIEGVFLGECDEEYLTIDQYQILWENIRHVGLKQEMKWFEFSTNKTYDEQVSRSIDWNKPNQQAELQLIKDEFYQAFEEEND